VPWPVTATADCPSSAALLNKSLGEIKESKIEK